MHLGDPAARISPETIYAAIYAQPRGGLKAVMNLAMRQVKPVRGLNRMLKNPTLDAGYRT